MIPDTLKGLLVDDWENVTKNRQVQLFGIFREAQLTDQSLFVLRRS